MTRDVHRFSSLARLLHWLIALAIPFQFWLGWASESSLAKEESDRLIRMHYQLGMILLALMALRLIRRMVGGAPPVLDGEPLWRKRAAASVHGMIYGLLILLPLSGYVIWVWMEAPMDVLGLMDVPRVFVPPTESETGRAIAWYVHFWCGWLLLGLIFLHVSAALWHQFVCRGGLIVRRMLWGLSERR